MTDDDPTTLTDTDTDDTSTAPDPLSDHACANMAALLRTLAADIEATETHGTVTGSNDIETAFSDITDDVAHRLTARQTEGELLTDRFHLTFTLTDHEPTEDLHD